MKLKTLTTSVLLLAFGCFLVMGTSSCKKEDDNADDNADKNYVLLIENGAQRINPNQSVSYSAKLIDKEGNATDAGNVTWKTSSSGIATISSSGVISVVAEGTVTITASVTIDGVTINATAPLGIYVPSLFTVAPCAILYEVGGSIQLDAIHLTATGADEPTCSYVSSDASVASVSNSGLVSFNKAGSCYITVTATSIQGNPVNIVPVQVIAPYTVKLPVVKVDITPSSADLFQNETVQLTAKAYDFDGALVSGKTPTWTTADASIVTVNSSGLVTPVNPGETYVYATIDGMMGQASLVVNPDTLVVVEPFYVNIPAGGTRQFTAKAYHITRTTASELTGVNFAWKIPTYGFSMFDIATVNSSGLVTMKSDAMAGMMTFVVAYDISNPYVGGASSIIAAIADDCDCGTGNPLVDHITVNQTSVNLSLMGTNIFQINAVAYDASNNPVTVDLVYCSNNIMAASVDSDGQIIAASARLPKKLALLPA
ncbi:MAG: Ig-like domain-containing protein [Bacteroidales bacterium]|nr:Ig-like domain-containing protein [Bacteroidales bacterium]